MPAARLPRGPKRPVAKPTPTPRQDTLRIHSSIIARRFVLANIRGEQVLVPRKRAEREGLSFVPFPQSSPPKPLRLPRLPKRLKAPGPRNIPNPPPSRIPLAGFGLIEVRGRTRITKLRARISQTEPAPLPTSRVVSPHLALITRGGTYPHRKMPPDVKRAAVS